MGALRKSIRPNQRMPCTTVRMRDVRAPAFDNWKCQKVAKQQQQQQQSPSLPIDNRSTQSADQPIKASN